jgi:hypothetical protein
MTLPERTGKSFWGPLPGLLHFCRLERMIAAACITGALILWLVLLLIVTPVYEAAMIVGPTPANNRNPLSSAIPASALALLGANPLSSSSVNDYQVFGELLNSEEVAQVLLATPGFKETVLKGQWDAQRNSFIESTGLRSRLGQSLGAISGLQQPRSSRRLLADYLRRAVSNTPMGVTGFNRIVTRHRDPEAARVMLASLYRAADDFLRQKRAVRLQTYLDYLHRRIEKATNEAERTALINLIVEQDRDLMLLQSGQPFAAEIVRGPSLETAAIQPRPLQWLALALLAGLAFAGLIIYRLRKTAT